MNNNRGGNNRRRGRGNNNIRPQGSNGGGGQGGQQVNRIDSRARGNAPQMLEKYRKLANDAHLNGDRVNAEYYLQFADHYFRVSADTRVRQEEQRLRRDDRWQEGGESAADEGDDAGEFGAESEFPAFDQPPVYTRRDREDRPERTPEPTGERVMADRGQDRPQSPPDYNRRDERPTGDGADNRQTVRKDGRDGPTNQRQTPASWGDNAAPATAPEGEAADNVTAYEPPENPFLRENRGARGLRPRREDRRPRREDQAEPGTAGDIIAEDISGQLGETQDTDRSVRAVSAGIDPDSLPPSFTVPRDEPVVAAEATPAPAPRRRARRKPAAESGDGSGAGEPIQSLI